MKPERGTGEPTPDVEQRSWGSKAMPPPVKGQLWLYNPLIRLNKALFLGGVGIGVVPLDPHSIICSGTKQVKYNWRDQLCNESSDIS